MLVNTIVPLGYKASESFIWNFMRIMVIVMFITCMFNCQRSMNIVR